MEFHDFAARIISEPIPYGPRCPPTSSRRSLMEFHDFDRLDVSPHSARYGATHLIRHGYSDSFSPASARPSYRYGSIWDDILAGGKKILGIDQPPSAGPPVYVAPPAPPLFMIGSFAVTPVKLAIGAAAAGALYFMSRKMRRGR
jgi:hypothetical protein